MPLYSPERKWPRLAPKNSLVVSIYAGVEQAYGLISNISEAGACMASRVAFKEARVLLRIGFEPEGEPFTTEARIIWCRDRSKPGQDPIFYYGVQFDLAPQQRAELKAILSSPAFKT